MAVAQDILTAEEHLQRRLLEMLFERPQAFPRVFIQESHTRIEGGAAPAFDSVIADLVHGFQDGEHLLHAHARGRNGLVPVAEHSFCNLNSCHSLPPKKDQYQRVMGRLLFVPFVMRTSWTSIMPI